MIDSLNVRLKAIDDANQVMRVDNVWLDHYAEVNPIQKGMEGGKCLVNDVLPYTTVDYVSYSSYDTTNPHKGNVGNALHQALDYIESRLPPKQGLRGKRVFIGEYGIPLIVAGTPENQEQFARDVCLASLEWGCPFVLYWELYCNEKTEGKHRGFWLINDKNQKQPFYYTLQHYYAGMRQTVAEFKKQHGRSPTDDELQKEAIAVLKAATSEPIVPADADGPGR